MILLLSACRFAVDFTETDAPAVESDTDTDADSDTDTDTDPDTDLPEMTVLDGEPGMGPVATEGQRVVAALPAQGRVLVWNAPDPVVAAEHEGPPGFGSALALRGGLLAVGSPDEGRAYVIDLGTGQVRLTIAGADGLGTAVALGDFDGGGPDLLIGAPGAGLIALVDATLSGTLDVSDLSTTSGDVGLGRAVLLGDLDGTPPDDLAACDATACYVVEGSSDGLDEPLLDDLEDWRIDLAVRDRPDAIAAGTASGDPVLWAAAESAVYGFAWPDDGVDEVAPADADAAIGQGQASLASSPGLVLGANGVWCLPGGTPADLGDSVGTDGGSWVADDTWLATPAGSSILLVESCF